MAAKRSARNRAARAPEASRPHMPGYGLPEGKRGLLSFAWAKKRLEKSHNYWICTVKPDAAPHAMVVWGLWLSGAFVFSTGSRSRKAKNLALNARCVVATEDASEAVIVEGEAELADLATRRRFLPAYERKYAFDMSSMRADILSLKEPVFVVHPRTVFGLPEKQFVTKTTRWRFRS